MRLKKALGLKSNRNNNGSSGDQTPVAALLRVQIVSCKELLSKDSNGFSDPYVTITLGKTTHQTPAISKTLNPIYDPKDATFDFPVGTGADGALELVVWDKDLVGKDYLGEAALQAQQWFSAARPLNWADAVNGPAFDVPLLSNKTKTASQGSVQLKLGLVGPDGSEQDWQKVYDRLVRREKREDESQVTGGVPTRGVGTNTEATYNPSERDTGGISDDESDDEDEDDDERKRRESAFYNDLHSSKGRGHDVLGVVHVEIVSASDLPKLKNMTRTGWDMDPFVVISFGKKIFRTRVIRHSVNPVWDEKLSFHVRRYERGFQLQLAVLDWDKMSNNDRIGTANVEVKDIIAAATNGGGSKEYTLPLITTDKEVLSKSKPTITFRAKYQSYAATRLKFWETYLHQYDTDETHATSHLELTSMLDSLGSTLSDETLDSFFAKFKQDPDSGELSFSQVAECLEELLSTPETSRRKVKLQDGEPIMMGVDRKGREVDLGGLSLESKEPASSSDEDAYERIVTIKKCPICHRNLQLSASSSASTLVSSAKDEPPKTQTHPDPQLAARATGKVRSEVDVMNHIAVCASHGGWKDVDKIVVGVNNEDLDEDGGKDGASKFVTASQAQRKWFAKIIGKVGGGEYKLGANSGNIIVQNRMTGQLEEEKMQVYVRLGIRLLYKGMNSRMEGARARRLLKSLSVKQGIKYDNPESAKEIPAFIEFHHLIVDEILDPLESFKNFNEFFYRKLKPSARPVESPDDPYRLVSGADCRLNTFSTVTEATQIWIKGREFSVSRLLGPSFADVAHKYEGGALAIFRLAPQDYHRFHSPVDGRIGKMVDIEGEYYTVNPQAIRTALDVYGDNVRKIVPIDSPQFGRVMAVCIGAMMVGSIKTTVNEGDEIKRGQEFGYFAFGGSTIVILFEEGRVEWDEDLLINARDSIETLVRVGMGIGRGKPRA